MVVGAVVVVVIVVVEVVVGAVIVAEGLVTMGPAEVGNWGAEVRNIRPAAVTIITTTGISDKSRYRECPYRVYIYYIMYYIIYIIYIVKALNKSKPLIFVLTISSAHFGPSFSQF